MRTHVHGPAVVAFVVVAIASFSTVAQASTWTIGAAFGAKPAHAQAEAVPSAPTSVTLTCVASNQKLLKVTWNGVSHASSYDIFYSTTSPSSGFSSAAPGVTGTSWTSTSLPNATYYVQVSANVGANWKSSNSATAGPRTIKNTAPLCS